MLNSRAICKDQIVEGRVPVIEIGPVTGNAHDWIILVDRDVKITYEGSKRPKRYFSNRGRVPIKA